MNARRIFIHLFAVAAVVAVADFAFGCLMSRYMASHILPGDYRKIDHMIRNPNDDILLLGPSVCMNSLVPAEFERATGLKCFNGGANDQTIEFCECMLEAHLEKHKPKCVILAIRPDELRVVGNGRLGMLRIYYGTGRHTMDRHLESDGPIEKLFLRSAFYRFNTHGWRMMLYAFKSYGEMAHGGFVAKPRPSILPKVIRMRGFSPGDKPPSPRPEKLAAFKRIVALCHNAGVKLAVVVPPVCRDAGGKRMPGCVMTEQICNEHAVPYFDDSLNGDFSGNPALFFDTNHLNGDGAKPYTRLVLEKLRERSFFE